MSDATIDLCREASIETACGSLDQRAALHDARRRLLQAISPSVASPSVASPSVASPSVASPSVASPSHASLQPHYFFQAQPRVPMPVRAPSAEFHGVPSADARLDERGLSFEALMDLAIENYQASRKRAERAGDSAALYRLNEQLYCKASKLRRLQESPSL